MTSLSTSKKNCKPPVLDNTQVYQVYQWILQGANEHDVCEAALVQWPDIDARPLILAAVQTLRDAGAVDREVVLGWCVEATRDLYRRMLDIGDHAGALKAVRQLANLTQ